MSLLTIDDLHVTLPGRPALVDGVSLTVDAGQLVGIAGESGSGKTVSALATLGFLPDNASTTGSVVFDGHDVLRMTRKQLQEMRGNDVAMVFQDPMTSLHPMLSIETQLTEHFRVHRSATKKQARARAVELLELVRIPNPTAALDAYPHRFSGGMRQRIAIASALACEPRLLIADEVTTALDVTVQAGILHLLHDLREQTGMAMLFITHDLSVMNVTTDYLYVMHSGKVVEHGPTRDVLAEPAHAYTRSLIEALPGSREILAAPSTAAEGDRA